MSLQSKQNLVQQFTLAFRNNRFALQNLQILNTIFQITIRNRLASNTQKVHLGMQLSNREIGPLPVALIVVVVPRIVFVAILCVARVGILSLVAIVVAVALSAQSRKGLLQTATFHLQLRQSHFCISVV